MILIATVLFGALSFALMRSGGGNSKTDKETLLIQATEIEQYGSELTMAHSTQHQTLWTRQPSVSCRPHVRVSSVVVIIMFT